MAASNGDALKYVGECLYRSHNGMYYALVKVSGKQIKRSLKTADLALPNADSRNSVKRRSG